MSLLRKWNNVQRHLEQHVARRKFPVIVSNYYSFGGRLVTIRSEGVGIRKLVFNLLTGCVTLGQL